MIAAFAASFVLLALEIAHVRLLSYVADPRLVYGAIGIALAGMSGASIVVAQRPSLAEGDVARRLSRLFSALAVTVVLSSLAIGLLGPSFVVGSFALVITRALPLLFACAAPYFVGGLALTIAVAASRERVSATWAWGLVGSALGALAAPLFMTRLGVDGELAGLAVVAAACALVLAREGFAIAALIACGVLAPFAPRVFHFRPDPRDLLGLAERTFARVEPSAKGPVRDAAAWDPMARVEVWSFPGPFGTLNVSGATTPGAPIKLVTQDGGAGTILIGFPGHDEPRKAWTERSVYATGYFVRPNPERVLVIGLGGGVDVVTALQHGARDVTGVEINGGILKFSSQTFDAFQGGVLSRPEVHLHHADGRSFLEQAERRGQRWQLLQMSGADTYSAGSGGAFMFSESYLYTVDAFRRYFRALDDDGVLALIRFGPEPLRAVISEAVALRDLGYRELPRRFVVLRQGICYGIVASKRPLDARDLERVHQGILASVRQPRVSLPMWDAMGFGIDEPLRTEYAPDQRATANAFSAALAAIEARDDAALNKLLDALPLDYAPTTDDRPFFFQFEKPHAWLGLFAPLPKGDFFAEGLLGYERLVIVFLLVAAALVIVPLLRHATRPLPREAIFFGALGLAFSLVELVVIQRTVLLLGLPTWSVALTIAALLVGAGFGSALAGRAKRERRAIAIAVACVVLLLFAYDRAFAPLVDALLGASTPVRALVMALMLLPLGAAMGVSFPIGLRLAGARAGAPAVAWALAVNGLASVLASLVATPVAMVTGFRALLAVAAMVYVVAAIAMLARRAA